MLLEEIQSRSRFAEKIKEEKNFRPIGSHVTSYNRNGEEGDYEVLFSIMLAALKLL